MRGTSSSNNSLPSPGSGNANRRVMSGQCRLTLYYGAFRMPQKNRRSWPEFRDHLREKPCLTNGRLRVPACPAERSGARPLRPLRAFHLARNSGHNEVNRTSYTINMQRLNSTPTLAAWRLGMSVRRDRNDAPSARLARTATCYVSRPVRSQAAHSAAGESSRLFHASQRYSLPT